MELGDQESMGILPGQQPQGSAGCSLSSRGPGNSTGC